MKVKDNKETKMRAWDGDVGCESNTANQLLDLVCLICVTVKHQIKLSGEVRHVNIANNTVSFEDVGLEEMKVIKLLRKTAQV